MIPQGVMGEGVIYCILYMCVYVCEEGEGVLSVLLVCCVWYGCEYIE